MTGPPTNGTHHSFLVGTLRVSIGLLGASPLQAGPMDSPGHAHQNKAQLVHEANHEVDHAWEVYHRAPHLTHLNRGSAGEGSD
jgi:hypothetical protein